MKKSVIGIFALVAMSFALASCGEKLLTEAQVQEEIQKGFDAGKAAVESEMNAKCESEFEARATAEFERMKTEAEAAAAATAKPTK